MNHIFKISVIFPSRARSSMLHRCVDLLFSKAFEPEKVEVVCWFDYDDPELIKNIEIANKFNDMRRRMIYYVGDGKGYGFNHLMINRCAELSIGSVIIQYNDDMEMMTEGWDSLYYEALYQKIAVGSAKITTPEQGLYKGYRFSCPAISRHLYNLCEEFSLGGNPSVDRCWEAFAINYPCEVTIDVHIVHHHAGTGDVKAVSERQKFYGYLGSTWGERLLEFDRIGKSYVNKVKGKL